MTAFRCTAKLLKTMKAKPVEPTLPATNRLGEWTANLIRVSRIQLVLAVSDRTRLGVVIDAAPYASVRDRFAEALFKALLYLDVPAELAAAEAESMRGAEIAASNSRSVLGTLNQFGYLIEGYLEFGEIQSATALTQRLAEMVTLSPKDVGFPADRVREAFGFPLLDFRARRGLPPLAGTPPY